MNRISLIVMTSSLIFVLGLVSGNLISFEQLDEAERPSSLDRGQPSSPDEQRPADLSAPADDVISTVTDADPLPEFDSFVQFANLQQAADNDDKSDIELVAGSAVDAVSTEAETRQLIESLFPDLNDDTLAGWVETYRGMSLDELSGLLQQKQLMPSIIPDSSIFADSVPDLMKVTLPSSGRDSAIQHCQQNLKHAHTIGYRRRQTFTLACDREPAAGQVRYRFPFDFEPGPVSPSLNKAHVAIEGHRQVMFLLNPGNILTRSGLFARQADGCLGVIYQGAILRVEGTTDLPLDASQISISADGTVTYRDLEQERHTAGTVKLVTVSDLSALDSEDGVHFTCSNDSEPVFQANEETVLIPESLEASNVDRDEEWKTLEHFTRLSQLPQ